MDKDKLIKLSRCIDFENDTLQDAWVHGAISNAAKEYHTGKRNSIKERAKLVPLRVKIRVSLMIWWLNIKHKLTK